MNPMKRKHGDISGVLKQSSTEPSAASGQETSVQAERPDKKPRLSTTLEVPNDEPTIAKNTSNSSQLRLSARARRLSNIQGEIGSDDKPKGTVRYGINGSLEYYSKDITTWVPAVYHNDLRGELINEAARAGQYDFAREQGIGLTDITSFLPSQRIWGPDRANWPEILFHPKPNTTKDVGQTLPLWYRGGRLLLDHDNHPMREFAGILPTTFSSQAEGWLIEATNRCDNSIHLQDIRGRMPKDIVVVRKGVQVTEQLFTLRTISQRTGRFRRSAGLVARHVRGGSDEINAGLERLLPAECIEKNSTRDLARVLTPAEVKALTNLNKGRYPQRGKNQNMAYAQNPASATETKKRKWIETATSTTLSPESVAKHEGGNNAKKARRAGDLRAGTQSVLRQGSSTGLYTPGLLTPEDSVPEYLDQTLFLPRNNHFGYRDPVGFRLPEGSNNNRLTHLPGGRSTIDGQTCTLESLQRPGQEPVYNTTSASHSQFQGLNTERYSYQDYRSSMYTEAHNPLRISHTDRGPDTSAFMQGSGSTYEVYNQTYHTLIGSPPLHQGSNRGRSLAQDFQDAPSPGLDIGGIWPIHGRSNLDVAAQTINFNGTRAEHLGEAFHGPGNEIQELDGDGHLADQTAPIPRELLYHEAEGTPIPNQDLSAWLSDEEVELFCRDVFPTTRNQIASSTADGATASEAFPPENPSNSGTVAEVPGDGFVYPDPTLSGGFAWI